MTRASTCLLLGSAILASGPALAGKKAKEYDLTFETTVVEGWVTKETHTRQMNLAIKMSAGKKALESKSDKEATSFVISRTILEVRDGRVVREEITFEKATHLVGGKKVPFDLQGKTVIVDRDEQGGFTAVYQDGSAVSEEDRDAISDVLSKKGKHGDDGTPDAQETLSPGKPVKVGEKWHPDVAKVAAGMMDLGDVDLEKSSAVMTLKSIKTVDGVDHARVVGTFSLVTSAMGELKLGKPLAMKVSLDATWPADGSVPDGKMVMNMAMKGSSKVDAGIVLDMKINMSAKFRVVVETTAAPASPEPRED